MSFPGALVVKNPPASVGDLRKVGSIPGLERSRGGGHGTPLQNSSLENPMDRGAWPAAVHRTAQSQTWLKHLNIHAHVIVESAKTFKGVFTKVVAKSQTGLSNFTFTFLHLNCGHFMIFYVDLLCLGKWFRRHPTFPWRSWIHYSGGYLLTM